MAGTHNQRFKWTLERRENRNVGDEDRRLTVLRFAQALFGAVTLQAEQIVAEHGLRHVEQIRGCRRVLRNV